MNALGITAALQQLVRVTVSYSKMCEGLRQELLGTHL